MDHIQLVNLAKLALDKVFSDRSVSRQETRDSLIELQQEIEVMLVAVTD